MSSDKKYKVIVSERAKQMFGTHIRFLKQVSKEAAAAKRKDITTAIGSLCYMPTRYPFVDGEGIIDNRKYHKMYLKNWYLILYRIEDDTVFVDFIHDCRQENRDLLR